LDTFAVADVVRLLASTTKTGQLTIEGDRGTGRVWFDEGSLVGGEPAADGTVVDAVTNLLRFKEGSFLFETDARPAQPTDPQSVVDVLVEAEERAETWREVEGVVPSLDVNVRLRDQLDASETTITRGQWAQLVVIGGGTSARDFASDLGLADLAAAVAIKELVDAGLASVGDGPLGPPPRPAPGTGFEDMPSSTGPELSVVGNVDAPADPFAGPAPVDTASVDDTGTMEPAPVDSAGVDPSLADTIEMPLAAETPRTEAADTPVEPRPTLRSLVRDVATAPVDKPFEPPAATSATAAPELVGPGSTDVALDTQLSAGAEDHSYLAAGDDDASLLPEPLLGDDAGEWMPAPEPVASAETDQGEGAEGEPEDMSAQLGSLSPAAAQAVAAAASDDDSNQSTLRKIISNGRG
jgi:hypothetical protein